MKHPSRAPLAGLKSLRLRHLCRALHCNHPTRRVIGKKHVSLGRSSGGSQHPAHRQSMPVIFGRIVLIFVLTLLESAVHCNQNMSVGFFFAGDTHTHAHNALMFITQGGRHVPFLRVTSWHRHLWMLAPLGPSRQRLYCHLCLSHCLAIPHPWHRRLEWQ